MVTPHPTSANKATADPIRGDHQFLPQSEASSRVLRKSSTSECFGQHQGHLLIVILHPRNDRAVDQNQNALTPTALVWDCDGELCSEDLENLMERLRSQDVNQQKH